MAEAARVLCAVCEREVPLSEAVVREATDYMAYFCGLDCFERWRTRAERSEAVATGRQDK